ncbi:DgyrCDS3008 [Dimorphilus gyrociliatus]|uniref:DgyrCDS3008 n=1 Tax=Dimorphilus gyrociliatus TaxID=2664684 RepID=A0A7I8VC41_9ANNE|nr:DgyrCDS3008 [Dimorphilus gyrociliatus]
MKFFAVAVLFIQFGLLDARSSTPFIVGGSESAKGRWPWQLSLQVNRGEGVFGHSCGAVLIKENWVLTAGHCLMLNEEEPDDYLLRAGAFRIAPVGDEEQTLHVEKIIIHPEFELINPGLPNDIALLKLKENADLGNPNINTISLPPNDSNDFAGNSDCWITGWGRTSGNATGASPVLMELNIPVLTNEVCDDRWSDNIIGIVQPILDEHICVGDDAGNLSACQGDSGGPLSCQVNGEWLVAGITSRGFPDCKGYPSVYTRTSKYIQWVNDTINE